MQEATRARGGKEDLDERRLPIEFVRDRLETLARIETAIPLGDPAKKVAEERIKGRRNVRGGGFAGAGEALDSWCTHTVNGITRASRAGCYALRRAGIDPPGGTRMHERTGTGSLGEPTASEPADHRIIRSRLLPGGDLVSAVLNRQLMMLADRGGSSGAVGRRWADVCAEEVSGLVGRPFPVPDDGRDPFVIERVARLDDVPRIASVASKRGLQNPDFLFVGRRDGRPAIQAADAKFSIETARSKQVSPAVVEALIGLGDLLRPLVGRIPVESDILAGVFLSPAFPLTELMLRGRHGIVRATVDTREVIALPAPARAFFAPLEGVSLMPVLAGADDLPIRIDASLLAGLYYFRLARAGIGCWFDATRPLLALNDRIEVDEPAVLAETEARAGSAGSAFALILAWDRDVESVRAQRAAVEQVAGLPVMSRELRGWVEAACRQLGCEPPSANRVRRRLGAWFRGALRERFGPMSPPIDDFGEQLRELGRVSASLTPRLPEETRRIVAELVALANEDDESGSEEEAADRSPPSQAS